MVDGNGMDTSCGLMDTTLEYDRCILTTLMDTSEAGFNCFAMHSVWSFASVLCTHALVLSRHCTWNSEKSFNLVDRIPLIETSGMISKSIDR